MMMIFLLIISITSIFCLSLIMVYYKPSDKYKIDTLEEWKNKNNIKKSYEK